MEYLWLRLLTEAEKEETSYAIRDVRPALTVEEQTVIPEPLTAPERNLIEFFLHDD